MRLRSCLVGAMAVTAVTGLALATHSRAGRPQLRIEVGADVTPVNADDLRRQLSELAPALADDRCTVRAVDANTTTVSTSLPPEPADAYRLFCGIGTMVHPGTDLALYFERLVTQRSANESPDVVLLASDLLDDGDQRRTHVRTQAAVRGLSRRNPRFRLIVIGLARDSRPGLSLADVLARELGSERFTAIPREALGEAATQQVTLFLDRVRLEAQAHRAAGPGGTR